MRYPVRGRCPVCSGMMYVTEQKCVSCEATLRGEFYLGEFSHLGRDSADFVRTFLRCRGNLKEVERELGVSYPTVRTRLDRVLVELGYAPETDDEERRLDVLEQVERGEMSAHEAIKILSKPEGGD
jgi:hypothetical protein